MLARGIHKALEYISKAVDLIVVLCAGLMVICVAINVFARYCLKIGIVWIEEFSTLMFVWVVFLGAFIALRNKAHLALGIVVNHLPPQLRKIDRVVVLVLASAFLYAMSGGGVILVRSVLQFRQRTAILRISSGWISACIPASGILMLLEVVRILICREEISDMHTDEGAAAGRGE